MMYEFRCLRCTVHDILDEAAFDGVVTAAGLARRLRNRVDMHKYSVKTLTPHVQAWLDARRSRLDTELINWSSSLP